MAPPSSCTSPTSTISGWVHSARLWPGRPFSAAKPYTDSTVIGTTIPNAYRAGVPTTDNWDSARAEFDALDPSRVFSNTFIDQLLP